VSAIIRAKDAVSPGHRIRILFLLFLVRNALSWIRTYATDRFKFMRVN
jgi:hypothetical protein